MCESILGKQLVQKIAAKEEKKAKQVGTGEAKGDKQKLIRQEPEATKQIADDEFLSEESIQNINK